MSPTPAIRCRWSSPNGSRSAGPARCRTPSPSFRPARSRTLDDAERVDVAGVVQRVATDTPGHLIAEPVAFDGTPFRLTVAGHWRQPLPQGLVNAQVRVTGVLGRLVQTEPQTRVLHLLVPDRDAITVIKPAHPEPFDSFAPSAGALEHLTPAVAPYRVRIRGFVTLATGAYVFLEGDRGAFRVDLDPGQDVPRIGTEIEASGFLAPATRRRSAGPCCEPPALRRACRKPWRGRSLICCATTRPAT